MKTTALAPDRNIEITEDEYDKQLLRKADMLTSEFTSNGGILTPTQSTRFIRKLVEQPTILNVARFITMPSDTHKIPKIGIGSRILRAAAETTALTQAQRSKPVTTQVTLTAKEVIAEVLQMLGQKGGRDSGKESARQPAADSSSANDDSIPF